MLLDDFHRLPAAEAREIVRVWADVPGWADALVAGRPYADVAALARRADELAGAWTEADLDGALAHHPRIGDRVTSAGANADHSRREQSAMRDAASDVARRIAEGNAAYEERFGRVFLIRAAGRSPEQILAELERRLDSDADAEWREAAGQLSQIAQLRLEDALDDDATPEAP
ncbi:2-oxo-4-hydroxy-4-carboxy-5-ureidoimidazoline decarboxylase [Microbacterium excoecariae]|uniref:2-oxo-4-hydroxy-4-carboxy-5-ureidoimidazoline decarboxylase n=1 Tax=Microbacterium excoecariae TaxID=2715210 RepID=UPI0014097605|nr:2-oxo-4-hydroxy-4-carboxy-5-ureidoimidazoline decarboxylase [Microbacterium excoecariae]NHI16129.1 2-oxo-4-hydroxy-4-carboxy-5-ureidoimidazoline decarboxylase [Microbacterium excoecariae]